MVVNSKKEVSDKRTIKKTEIFVTTDYHKFEFVYGNRKLNSNHVRLLIDSINREDLLDKNPIIVNEKMEVIDGQHRLEAARQLRLPIYYVVQDESGLRAVQLLNATKRTWNHRDYLDSYITLDNMDYQILDSFVKKHNVPLGFAMILLGDETYAGYGARKGTGNSLFARFKRGEFKVLNLEKAEKTITQLKVLSNFAANPIWGNKEFLRAFEIIQEKGYSFDEFVKKLQVSGIKIYSRATVKDYLRDFEDILNFKRAKDNRVSFVTAY